MALSLGGCDVDTVDNPQVSPEEGVNQQETVVEEVNFLNQAAESLSIEMGEADLGAVVHNVDEGELSKLNLNEFTAEPVEESFLFIPKYIGSQITAYSVIWEEDHLATGDVLFKIYDIQNNGALYIKCPVPEGIPAMKVVITYEDQSSEYVITYDGSGMREQVEFLMSEVVE